MCPPGEKITEPPTSHCVCALGHSHHVPCAPYTWSCQLAGNRGHPHIWGTVRSMLSCTCPFIPGHLLPSSQEAAVEFVSKYRQGWPLVVCRHPFWPLESWAFRGLTARGQLQAHTWSCWCKQLIKMERRGCNSGVKALAAKSEDLSSIPRTPIVLEGKK